MASVLRFIASVVLVCTASHIARADEAPPIDVSPDQNRLDEIAEKIVSLERRLDALELAFRSQPGSSPASSGHSIAVAGIALKKLSEVSRLVVRDPAASGHDDPTGVSTLCRVLVEAQLSAAGFMVVSTDQEADAEFVLTTAFSQKGRGFMGITSEEENINLSFVVLVRSLPNHEVLFSYTNDTDGTPSEACKSLSRSVVSKLTKAKAASATPQPAK